MAAARCESFFKAQRFELSSAYSNLRIPAAVQLSGTVPAFGGGSLTVASTAYPYTFAYAVTPEVPGATTTSISVVCNLGVASGFAN